MASSARLRVALANDFELILVGLKSLLAPFEDRIDLVDTTVDEDDAMDRRVDVALFDDFAHGGTADSRLRSLLDDPKVDRVAVYTWQIETVSVDRALTEGVAGYLSKGLQAADLVDALERIGRGETVVSPSPRTDRHTPSERTWPGADLGLSERESEILVLIAEGSSNAHIAEVVHLSPNSVKTHIRNAYRKIGAQTRAQAVRLVVDAGMTRPAGAIPAG
ncbi:MAG: response regulator transcription factor [Actinomycetota bacterium]|nr:response regulator transcription factor [Actinomycetota bacterium]